MQKKEDKVGNETGYKEGRQRKNTESETEKDRNRSLKKFQFWFVRRGFCEQKCL